MVLQAGTYHLKNITNNSTSSAASTQPPNQYKLPPKGSSYFNNNNSSSSYNKLLHNNKSSPSVISHNNSSKMASMEDSIRFSVQDFLNHKTNSSIEAQYELGRMLGEGGFGVVYECTQKYTLEERAAKKMEKDPRHDDINEEVIREFHVLKEMDHPNIVKVYDLFEGKYSCVVCVLACSSVFAFVLLVSYKISSFNISLFS